MAERDNKRSVTIRVTESCCRGAYFKAGDSFVVKDLCPPLCHELWQCIYPQVYALLNGAELDCGDGRATHFCAACPDEGRVKVFVDIDTKN